MITFETTLTGSDDDIDGIVTTVADELYPEAYRFDSLDNSLHLIIARAIDGNWIRLAGTEPSFSGWVDELADKVVNFKSAN